MASRVNMPGLKTAKPRGFGYTHFVALKSYLITIINFNTPGRLMSMEAFKVQPFLPLRPAQKHHGHLFSRFFIPTYCCMLFDIQKITCCSNQ